MASSTASTTVSPAASSLDALNPGPSSMTQNSSLPFSFLITFVAIFLFFLGCGLGSRRVTRTLRQNLGLDFAGPSGRRTPPPARERPLIWDIHATSKDGGAPTGAGTGVHTWNDLVPICATYVRHSLPSTSTSSSSQTLSSPTSPSAQSTLHPDPEPPPAVFRWAAGGMGGMGFALARAGMRTVPPSPTHLTPRRTASTTASAAPHEARTQPEMRWRGHRIPAFLLYPLLSDIVRGPASSARNGSGSEAQDGQAELEMADRQPVKALQILVLVSMPSPERAIARTARAKALEAGVLQDDERGAGKVRAEVSVDEGRLGEYALGVARVQWHADGAQC